MDSDPLQVSMPTSDALIAAGSTGLIYIIDETRVMKRCVYGDHIDLATERQAYKRLGSHPSIAGYYGATKNGSAIILERGKCLRDIYQQVNADDIPIHEKLRWATEAATGLRYIHGKGIIHADVGCSNLILTQDRHLKFIDFAGSSIDGEEATVCYEWCTYRPSVPTISIQTDIFAYGCTIFEIETGRPPYYEFELRSDRTRHIERLYQEHKFPNLQHLMLGELIRNCWDNKFRSMDEVIQALTELTQKINMTTH
ncbi:putative protein kinase-like domain [Phaeomoniella chlamydospora]|uniref:Protein kinase domain-containing protein n=1 Tax=Phaeomoniella chlamydospora TaxID=158046 RepID=A0A0G2DUP1_PHACM|nr:putative protein kinase-like domain [Phaeomoniella chlamydospora]